MAEDAYIRALREAWLPKFASAPGRAIANTGLGAFQGLVDAGGYAADAALGLESADPWAGTKERFGKVNSVMEDLVAPVQSAIPAAIAGQEAASGVVTDFLESLRNRRMAQGAASKAGPEDMQPVPTARRRPPGAFAALPAQSPQPAPGPVTRVSGTRAVAPPTESMVQPGAFSDPTWGATWRGSIDNSGAPAEEASPVTQQAPQTSQESIADLYRTRRAALPERKGEVSEKQKQQLALDFFLGMLANNNPGSRFLQNAGKSGQGVSAKYTTLEEKAQAQAERARAQDETTLAREMGFEGQSRDDVRADRREMREDARWHAQDKRETERWKALDQRERERLNLLRDQFEAGGNQVIKRRDGVYVLNERTGKTTKTPLPPEAERNSQIEFYQWLSKNPDAQKLFMEGRGRTMTEEDTIDKALKLIDATKGIDGPTMTLDQAKAAVRGGGATQSIPAGLPAGTTYEGTSGGKRVFKKPDGNMVIEK